MNIFESLEGNNFSDDTFKPRKTCKPTQTQVGTEDRVTVYAKRVQNGESLWHEEDRTSLTKLNEVGLKLTTCSI